MQVQWIDISAVIKRAQQFITDENVGENSNSLDGLYLVLVTEVKENHCCRVMLEKTIYHFLEFGYTNGCH